MSEGKEPDMRYIIQNGNRRNGWEPYPSPTKGPPEVVRYRWSPSMRCYVEVVLSESGYYHDGFTMPDGFVPPEGMR